MADITIVNGVYKPTYNWGAPSCEDMKTTEHLIVGICSEGETIVVSYGLHI
jgi:hypothetical protein